MDSSKHHLTDIIDARYLIMLSKGEKPLGTGADSKQGVILNLN